VQAMLSSPGMPTSYAALGVGCGVDWEQSRDEGSERLHDPPPGTTEEAVMAVHTSPANHPDRHVVEGGTRPRSEPPRAAARSDHEVGRVRTTRTSAAWAGIAVGAAVLVLLIVFMLQNTVPVDVFFLGLHATAPLALTLLIAGLGFAVVTLVVGSLRIGQLRRRIRRGSPRAETERDVRG